MLLSRRRNRKNQRYLGKSLYPMDRKIILLAAVLLAGTSLRAQTAAVFLLDSLLTHFNANDKFIGAVQLQSAGNVVYSAHRGQGNGQENVGPDSRYRVGSVSKLFTAVMVMQEVEKGRLSLDGRLAAFFPQIPGADSIRIRQLLNHSSGLTNFTDDPAYLSYMTQPMTQAQLLDTFLRMGSSFQPGSRHQYSNTNFVLLGYILERVTGKRYEDLLQKRIVRPLRMTATAYNPKQSKQAGEAISFFRGMEQTWEPAPISHPSIPHGAGGIVSTPADLCLFIEGLFGGKLVSEASLKEMTRMQEGFGLGIFKFPFYDTYAYGHGGRIDGFETNLAYFPESETAVAVCASGVGVDLNDLMIGILSCWYGKTYDFPVFDRPAVVVPLEELRRYTGNYVSEQLPLQITVRLEGQQLMAQASGQSAFPLKPLGAGVFEFEPARIVMEFKELAGEHGRQSFTLVQSGMRFLYKKQ